MVTRQAPEPMYRHLRRKWSWKDRYARSLITKFWRPKTHELFDWWTTIRPRKWNFQTVFGCGYHRQILLYMCYAELWRTCTCIKFSAINNVGDTHQSNHIHGRLSPAVTHCVWCSYPEASKIVMQYVASVCGKEQEIHRVMQMFLQSNPLLEGQYCN